MPESAAKILAWLDLTASDGLPADWRWGAALCAGHVTKPAQMLFPRIELEAGVPTRLRFRLKTRYLDVFVGDIRTGVFVTRSPHFIEISDAMHRAMERVVLKKEDPKKSLDQACTDIDRALARN